MELALMNGLRNCIVACFLFFFPQLAAAPPNIWIGTWATAPEASIPALTWRDGQMGRTSMRPPTEL